MPRQYTILQKKYRLPCPSCATSRAQRFVNKEVGVVCACGNILGAPLCFDCNTPGDHPHQINTGRWACVPCQATFTYPRGRKTTKRRQRFTTTKKTAKRVTRLSQMSLETMLVEMLVLKNRHSSVDGASPAKFENSISNLLVSPSIAAERAVTPQSMDVLDCQYKKTSEQWNECAILATPEMCNESFDSHDQDSSDEIRSNSCEEMISESFTNQLSDSDSESYLDGTDDTLEGDIAPVTSCMTFYRG